MATSTEDCASYGQPGDGRTYDPPNTWGKYEASVRDQPAPDYFGKIQMAFNLPSPPDAAGVSKELSYLHVLKDMLRPGLTRAIDSEKYHFTMFFLDPLRVANRPPSSLMKTFDMMGTLVNVAGFWVFKEKARFNRPRPVQIDGTLAPPFCPGHPSYPSGHATQAFSVAFMLTDATPQSYHARLISQASQIAFHREVAGVHYPSDTEGGFIMASQIVGSLRQDRLYQDAIAEVRAELAASPTLP